MYKCTFVSHCGDHKEVLNLKSEDVFDSELAEIIFGLEKLD